MRIHYQLALAAALVVLAVAGWLLLGSNSAQNGTSAARQMPPTPVDVMAARSGAVRDTIEVVGTARAQEAVTIVPRASGRIAAIRFEEGEMVAAGEPLIELDSAQEQAELRRAQAQLEDARAQYARARSLGGGRNIADAEVDRLRTAVAVAEAQLEIARARLREQRIVAPFTGIVGIREVSLGAMVDPQTRLTTLDDVSRIRLDFHVPERFLAQVAIGRSVTARSSAFPSDLFQGQVHRIDSRVDPVTRNVRVQALIDNPDRRLRPGMFLNIELVLDERAEAILVPEEALVVEGGSRFVFVVRDGVAHRVEVDTGTRNSGLVELTSGVEAGELVVVAGVNRLRSARTHVFVRNNGNAQAGR